MTDRPILFSGPMVRALLDGRKTQTRRIVKPQPSADAVDAGVTMSGNPAANGVWCWLDAKDLMDASQVGETFRCPYGVPGDRLWVKETWGLNDCLYGGSQPIPKARPIDLPADALVFYATEDDAEIRNELRWRPSIHMPRWASRLTLDITEVRVERLHEISAADSLAEGVQCPTCEALQASACNGRGCFASIAAYRDLWNHINGPDNWAANPWVWVVTFEVERP